MRPEYRSNRNRKKKPLRTATPTAVAAAVVIGKRGLFSSLSVITTNPVTFEEATKRSMAEGGGWMIIRRKNEWVGGINQSHIVDSNESETERKAKSGKSEIGAVEIS